MLKKLTEQTGVSYHGGALLLEVDIFGLHHKRYHMPERAIFVYTLKLVRNLSWTVVNSYIHPNTAVGSIWLR